MSYADYLASRGYQRAPVERTNPQPGHFVLERVDRPARRIEGAQTVVRMKGRGRGIR